MAPKNVRDDPKAVVVEQGVYPVPDIPIKDLLAAIPAHCFERSALKSSVYIFWDLFVTAAAYKATVFADSFVTPEFLSLPHPALYTAVSFSLWCLYGFFAGLFLTGIWVIGHECGHQAFSESKTINNTVGWILHSAVGVPYHSWRISHAKHHASTGHMTQDQVFVPPTRSGVGLPPFDPARETLLGDRVTQEIKREFWEALGDSPIGAVWFPFTYLIGGWILYITTNASGQTRYPKGTNHFTPSSVIFSEHHYGQVIMSVVGIVFWLAGIATAIYYKGFLEVFRAYFVPYLWVNHWLVLITFLQHTDPLLPHYRASEFTFSRGALATLDRHLLGDCGSFMSWLGAHATNGISETHILHHVSSKIPHYNAWEASAALKKFLAPHGVPMDGGPGGWSEMIRVFRECKFVEDEGDVVFFKDAYGLAKMKPLMPETSGSDSGVEVK